MDIKEKILAAREDRSRKIEFLKKAFKAVITVKSNIPGNQKNHPIAYLLIEEFKNAVDTNLFEEITFYDSLDGPYYLIGSNVDVNHLKSLMISLEETHPLGRMIDIDVYVKGEPVSRGYLRRCLLCEHDAIDCMRNKRHTVEALIDYMSKQVKAYLTSIVSNHLHDAVFTELKLEPKFGLVTPSTSGSHPDMDYALMEKAYHAIHPYLLTMFELGWDNDNLSKIFQEIRQVGLEAEKRMFDATAGINAYKGLIFNLGLVVAGLGYAYAHHYSLTGIFDLIRTMTQSIMDDFKTDSDQSFGVKAYREYAMTGARGEAFFGMPHVQNALELMKEFKDHKHLRTLMYLISEVDDTVLLKRAGSFKSYQLIRLRFQKHINAPYEKLLQLDQECRSKKLSFGGSADLLIVTIFLHLSGIDKPSR